MKLTVGSLFSGIGGFDLGFERAGMEIRWQVEIDKQARSVSRRHWPNVTQHEDVRNVGRANLEPVDVICGGFPCQDLSVAGRRAGLAGKRSGLFWELCRIVEELRPRWVVLENVPGLLSSNGGRDMGVVLGALGQLGYGFAYRVLDAQYFGLAQRRKRVFIVASPGDGTGPAQVLFEPDSVSWDSPPRREMGKDVAGTVAPGFGVRGASDPDRVTFVPAVSPAIKARDGKGPSSDGDGDGAPLVAHSLRAEGFDASEDGTGRGTPIVPCSWNGDSTPKASIGVAVTMRANQGGEGYGVSSGFGVRRLTPRECEKLQGFPPDWTRYAYDGRELADGPRYRMLGNAVAVPCAEWIGRRLVEVAAR